MAYDLRRISYFDAWIIDTSDNSLYGVMLAGIGQVKRFSSTTSAATLTPATPVEAPDGSRTVFTFPNSPQLVTVGGQVRSGSTFNGIAADYSVNGNQVTFAVPPKADDNIMALVSSSTTALTQANPLEVPNGSRTSFTFSSPPKVVAVGGQVLSGAIYNGIAADYSITGNVVTFATAPKVDDNIIAFI